MTTSTHNTFVELNFKEQCYGVTIRSCLVQYCPLWPPKLHGLPSRVTHSRTIPDWVRLINCKVPMSFDALTALKGLVQDRMTIYYLYHTTYTPPSDIGPPRLTPFGHQLDSPARVQLPLDRSTTTWNSQGGVSHTDTKYTRHYHFNAWWSSWMNLSVKRAYAVALYIPTQTTYARHNYIHQSHLLYKVLHVYNCIMILLDNNVWRWRRRRRWRNQR